MLRKQVHVRQQVSETSKGLVWTPTKGKQDRWVTLEAHIVEPLAKQCEGKKRDDLVFTAPKGGVLRLNSWRDRTWNPAVETLTDADDDFPRVTPHDLRHTAASLSVSAGANIKALQAMLGHEDATETLNTYAEHLRGIVQRRPRTGGEETGGGGGRNARAPCSCGYPRLTRITRRCRRRPWCLHRQVGTRSRYPPTAR